MTTPLDPIMARPHHLLPYIPVRKYGEFPLGPDILEQIIDAALPYGRRLLLLRRYRKLSREGLLVV